MKRAIKLHINRRLHLHSIDFHLKNIWLNQVQGNIEVVLVTHLSLIHGLSSRHFFIQQKFTLLVSRMYIYAYIYIYNIYIIHTHFDVSGGRQALLYGGAMHLAGAIQRHREQSTSGIKATRMIANLPEHIRKLSASQGRTPHPHPHPTPPPKESHFSMLRSQQMWYRFR